MEEDYKDHASISTIVPNMDKKGIIIIMKSLVKETILNFQQQQVVFG